MKRLQRITSTHLVGFIVVCLLAAGLFHPAASANTVIAEASNFTTFFGGSEGEDATKVTFDNEGNTVLIGQTPSDDLPTTEHAFQDTYGGGSWDAFVAKFSSAGELLFSSYIGGSGYEHVTSVNVDSENNMILAGTTGSPNFPTTPNGLDTSFGGLTDGFIMKIAPNGTLLYSSYFGGSGNDWIYGIQFDASENYMFSGWTESSGLGTAGTFSPLPIGGQDAFIARVSASGDSLQMFSYVGGTGMDHISSLDIDSDYNYVLAGRTESTDYPVSGNAFQSSHSAGIDAVLTKISHDGTTLIYSTLLGGNDDDMGLAIAVDSSDNMILSGYTESDDLSVHNAYQESFGGGFADIYVAKFNKTGSLQFLTYLGGNETDYCWEVAVDPSDNIVVGGRSSSSNYPAHNGLNDTHAGSFDAVATKFSSDGQTILVSSFIGGSGSDIGEGLAIDSEGNVVITGRTVSTDFPVTSGAYMTEIGGSSDVFVCHTAFNPPLTVTTSSNSTTTNTGSGLLLDSNTLLLMAAGSFSVVIVIFVILKRK